MALTTTCIAKNVLSHWIGRVAGVSVDVDTPPLPVTQRTADHKTVQLYILRVKVYYGKVIAEVAISLRDTTCKINIFVIL